MISESQKFANQAIDLIEKLYVLDGLEDLLDNKSVPYETPMLRIYRSGKKWIADTNVWHEDDNGNESGMRFLPVVSEAIGNGNTLNTALKDLVKQLKQDVEFLKENNKIN